MSDAIDAMLDGQREKNEPKYRRVEAVIAQLVEQGRDDDLKPTVVARRAGVSRSFVHNHFEAKLKLARTDVQARFVSGLAGQTALTAASLRVEAETAKQEVRRLQDENRRLKAKLARTLGHAAADDAQDSRADGSTERTLRDQVTQLLADEVDLRRETRELHEELEATQRLNRRLMLEANSARSSA